ncbi:MAG TPA: DUF2339 domain-containing protein [Steroidobacteraceae bacterium]|nr:DUF2339 domain-containing protein [Steroidobacteraceae bacterium]
MFPAIRIVFAVVGAVLGAKTGSGGGWFFATLVGAFIGLAIVEFASVRGRMLTLEEDIAKLRASLRRREAEAPAPAPSPAAPPAAPPATSAPAAAALAAAPRTVASASQSPMAALDELRREGRAAAYTPGPAMRARLGARPQTEKAGGETDIPIFSAVRAFFTGSNALVRAGVIVLFFGVAFLLRYVAEHTRVPIEVRLAGVAMGAIVLLALGWSLRKSRPGYALALQGGAVGILYLIIFAALHLYALLPASAAFLLLAVVAGLGATLAILQNSMAFALLAVTGGFLAPILASNGEGNHVVLFSYYAVLNAAIVAIAWFKAWRPLNLAGFVFTFVIGTLWGVLRYRAEDFSSTEPFLVLFFLFYVAVAVLFTLRQPANLAGYVDGTLVFGLPIVAFGLQAAMLHDSRFVLAYSAAAVSAMYLAIAWFLYRARSETQRVLIEAFVALGVVFLTLAVPLALDSRWNAATWALEGSALIWVGCRQQRRLPRAFGAILTIAAGCVIAQDLDFSNGRVVLKLGSYLGVLSVSAASVFSARTLHVHRQRLEEYEHAFAAVLFLWGLCWWCVGGLGELTQYTAPAYLAAALLIFAALTALVSSELYRRTDLDVAKAAALFLLPVMTLFAGHAVETAPHPFAQGGWISWPVAFLIFYLLAHRHEGAPGGGVAKALHVGSAWLLVAIASWEAAWAVNYGVHGSESWRAAAWAAMAVLAVFFLPRLATRVHWPFRVHREAYLFTAGVGYAVYLGLWSLATNLALPGDADPLPYLPVLNPLDIAQVFALLVIVRYWRFLRAVHLKAFAELDPRLLPAILAGLAFIWANGVLLRTLHQWGGVPFSLGSFVQSTLTQTALSIFWAVLSLTLMLVAARMSARTLWLGGAALLAVVVAKLFLVDLSRVGSIERIVSFVGVGLLMLIVGYVSPLPPAVEQRR